MPKAWSTTGQGDSYDVLFRGPGMRFPRLDCHAREKGPFDSAERLANESLCFAQDDRLCNWR